MKKSFLIGLMAAAMLLAQGDVAKKGSFDLNIAGGKDPEIPTLPGKKGSFDLTIAGGKDPEFPTTPGKKGSFDITELDGKGDE